VAKGDPRWRPQVDSIDRRIYQTLRVEFKRGTSSQSTPYLKVQDSPELARTAVLVELHSGYGTSGSAIYMSVSDLDACIRILTLAKERLEALGTIEGLEKIVP
jgi:hypothetical protein